MSWEREHHHMNLAEDEHLIRLVDRTVTTQKGEPMRYLIQIKIGEGPFEYAVGKHKIRVKLGGDFTVEEDGTIHDSEGTVFDPKDFEKTMIAKLNAHHRKLRAYAKKHGAPEYKGPPKTA